MRGNEQGNGASAWARPQSRTKARRALPKARQTGRPRQSHFTLRRRTRQTHRRLYVSARQPRYPPRPAGCCKVGMQAGLMKTRWDVAALPVPGAGAPASAFDDQTSQEPSQPHCYRFAREWDQRSWEARGSSQQSDR